MKKIILPFFVCVIACLTITSCSKDVKSPVAKTTNAATTKKPSSNTQSPSTNQSDHQGGCNHSSNGYGSGSAGGYNGY
jgi:hypothetical protein